MSYDVYLRSEKCPTCGHYGPEPDKLGPTYNLTPIFHLALTGEDMPSPEVSEGEAVVLGKKVSKPRGLRVLDGITGAESIQILETAIRLLTNESMHHKFRSLEPENGWGDLPGAIRVISTMLDNAREFPKNTWSIQ